MLLNILLIAGRDEHKNYRPHNIKIVRKNIENIVLGKLYNLVTVILVSSVTITEKNNANLEVVNFLGIVIDVV